MARRIHPGTRAYRELLRTRTPNPNVEPDTDAMGLYSPGDKPNRKTLVHLGGRAARMMGARAFRISLSKAAEWFLIFGVWDDNGKWQSDVPWNGG